MLFSQVGCKIPWHSSHFVMDFDAIVNIGETLSQAEVESVLIDQLARSRAVARDEVLLEMERTGGIDSLEGLELAMEAERAFKIKISDDELEVACRSIPELATLVRSKLRADGEEGEVRR